jgi:hypothetical protein
VSLYGVIESDLAVFHSLGMIAFTVVLGSGAMCLARIVMLLGGFKVCVFCHIHSPCPEFPFWKPSLHIYDSKGTSCGLFRIAHTAQLIEHKVAVKHEQRDAFPRNRRHHEKTLGVEEGGPEKGNEVCEAPRETAAFCQRSSGGIISTMTLKTAAFFALIGMTLLTVLLALGFIRDVSNFLAGAIAAMALLISLIRL